TLRTKLRISDVRPLLISVRRAILRAALRAEGVLGMAVLVLRAAGWPTRRRAARYRKKRAAARASPHTARLYWPRLGESTAGNRDVEAARDRSGPTGTGSADGGFRASGGFAAPDQRDPFLARLSRGCGNLGARRGRRAQAVIARRHRRLLACGKGGQRR